MGYTVVDAGTVIATHLSSVIQAHAAELLGREEVQKLLDHLAKESPKLIEDLVPKLVPLATLQKVLQNLLDEGVHIRDMRTILETLAEHARAPRIRRELTAAVRVALARAIMQQTLSPGAGRAAGHRTRPGARAGADAGRAGEDRKARASNRAWRRTCCAGSKLGARRRKAGAARRC